MLLSFGLIVILFWHFYLGYSRGLVKQIYFFLATLAGLVVANLYYERLADRLTLWVPYTQAVEEVPLPYFAEVNIFEMDMVFYAGLAFFIIFLAVFLVLKAFGLFLHFFPLRAVDDVTLNLISGALSVLVTLMFLNLFLTLAATLPVAFLQRHLENNLLIKVLINHFPILSQLIRHLWVVVPLA